MKDEREILTRQSIQKKLIYEAQRSWVASLLMCFLGAIVYGFMFLLSHEIFAAKLIVCIFAALNFIVCAFFFVRAISRMIRAKHGNFTIVEDVLTEIKDNEFSMIQFLLYGGWHSFLGNNKSHLKHVFKFQSGKIFIANVEEYKHTRLHSAAEFSLAGDVFYLVFYNNSPNKIILLFTSKTHVLKED